ICPRRAERQDSGRAQAARSAARDAKGGASMRAPYPLELVPLFPEFLTKRRTKFTFPLRLTEELGIDRPAFFFVVGGVAPRGGGRYSEMWNPYATQWDQHRAASAAARDAGLVDEKDGRWDLTPKAR